MFGFSFVYFNDIVFTKVYDKRDDFDCEVVNFPFLESDIARSTPYGVYISQFIQFARSSSHIADSNTRNKFVTQKLLKQGYRYRKFQEHFFDLTFICITMIWHLNSMSD